MTDHLRSPSSRAVSSALASTMPALFGTYLGAIEQSLPKDTFLVCDFQALSHPLAMLHIIHPLAARDAAKGEGTEPEMRAKYLRSTGIDARLVNFTAPLALKAFAQAGQKPGFEGLCEISDPDLFMSAMAFAINSVQKGRDFLGYRDGRNLVEKRFHKNRDKLVVVHGSAEPIATAVTITVGDTVLPVQEASDSVMPESSGPIGGHVMYLPANTDRLTSVLYPPRAELTGWIPPFGKFS